MSFSSAEIARECRVFTRYLTGEAPSEYLAESYLRAHDERAGLVPVTVFDVLGLRLAHRGTLATRLIDIYARVVAPCGLLRRKLSLLLALLESSPEASAVVERVSGGPRWWLLVQLAGRVTLSILVLAVALVLVSPIHLAARLLAATSGGSAR